MGAVTTAQRRSEDLQDVPVSVQALDAKGLEELNIDTFEDYLDQLPTVTAGGSGPGQSTIYIRGLASTTPNLTTALSLSRRVAVRRRRLGGAEVRGVITR